MRGGYSAPTTDRLTSWPSWRSAHATPCDSLCYIDEEDVTTIEIPSALKPEILLHLRVAYGIEASTVYNDGSDRAAGES